MTAWLGLSPLVFAAVPDGYVVKVESSTVYLDWGKSSGIQAGDEFKIYREGEPLKHPVTGEILGKSELDLGRGLVDHVEDKFSVGKIVESNGSIKAGDRTRRLETAPAPSTAPAAAPGAGAQAPANGPKEVWRSDPIKNAAVGLALGDVDGDGKKEVVVAYPDQIEVFKWNGQKLDSMATFKNRSYGNFLAIETADPAKSGHDTIFASLFNEGIKRSRTVVLEYTQGTLKEVGRMDGFIRAVGHADGSRELLWQDTSMSRELRIRPPADVVKKDKNYRVGENLKFARVLNDDQLFGYAWGDWDGDGEEDLAVLQHGQSLRIFFKNANWSADEEYGGSQRDFTWENGQLATLWPRLISWKPESGKMQLLVPHNIQAFPIHVARLKIYKESEIVDLAWNGLQMAPVWTLPIKGALADFGTGDVLGRGTPQLWVAAIGAGDKTVLLAYQIP